MPNELDTIEREIENTFDDFFGGRTRSAADYRTQWSPYTDVSEDKEAYVLQIALPGVKKEAVETEVKEDTLVISGKRDMPELNGRSLIRREIPSGRFYRAFTLDTPVRADSVKATMRDGLLEIYLPKAEGSKVRKIKVE